MNTKEYWINRFLDETIDKFIRDYDFDKLLDKENKKFYIDILNKLFSKYKITVLDIEWYYHIDRYYGDWNISIEYNLNGEVEIITKSGYDTGCDGYDSDYCSLK